MSTYQEEIFNSWSGVIEKKKVEELEIPLLLRNEGDGTLKVNFSPGTIKLLNEVKHLKKEFPHWNIPANAKMIFKRFEELRIYNNGLDKLTSLYNYLKTDTNDKEYKLFENELLKIDEVLHRAETVMTWNSDDITEYLERVLDLVSELNERVRQTQDNVKKIVQLISQWRAKPLYVRNSNPSERDLLHIKRRDELKAARYEGLTEAAEKMVKLVKENEGLFEVELDVESSRKAWHVYLRHLDSIVLEALLHTGERSAPHQEEGRAEGCQVFS